MRNLELSAEDLAVLGERLEKMCGAGGSIKRGRIEIQGDHLEQVAAVLIWRGTFWGPGWLGNPEEYGVIY